VERTVAEEQLRRACSSDAEHENDDTRHRWLCRPDAVLLVGSSTVERLRRRRPSTAAKLGFRAAGELKD
jgi:hypothetical protein